MNKVRQFTPILAFLALASFPTFAQNRTTFGGQRNAAAYAYGITPGAAGLTVYSGVNVTGAGTLTLNFGYTAAGDGTVFYPLNTNAPVLIGTGAQQETVTPTAVSCLTPTVYATCTFTATFTKTHGAGDQVASGTAGLQEAINLQASGVNGTPGGKVIIDAAWTSYGGTNTIIAAATAYSTVTLVDNRSANQVFWSMQPSTLTSLAAPTTLAAGTVVFAASPVGTWAASAYYFCVTYVDALGGEGPCSATYNQTPTLNYSVTITSPAASTGAVGWRFYAGASYNAAYLMPITSSNCTLTALESVMPACAIGSNGVWLAPPATTTTLRPNAQSPTVNLNLPYPQGHTTFAYAPAANPVPFQSNYGPFPAFGALTAGQLVVAGSVNLPTGYLNTIGRTVRITGKLTLGSVNTATLPTLAIQLGWVGGTTAGAPVSMCVFSGPAVGSTVVYNMPFSCTITTNAVGATAIGSVMPAGSAGVQVPTGAAVGQTYQEQAVAAIGSLGLFAQNTVYVTYTSTTNTTAAPQLLDLSVETLQ